MKLGIGFTQETAEVGSPLLVYISIYWHYCTFYTRRLCVANACTMRSLVMVHNIYVGMALFWNKSTANINKSEPRPGFLSMTPKK